MRLLYKNLSKTIMSELISANKEMKDLLITVVQAQDADIAIDALVDADFVVTRLPSVGGFLGRKNVTLMIGIEENRQQSAIDILTKTCSQRIAYIAVPMENSPLPMPVPMPVTVGGANIFAIEVEHFEEI